MSSPSPPAPAAPSPTPSAPPAAPPCPNVERVAQLRAEMRARGLDAYLVPSADAHQSEYVPACWQRRAWLSGFTGSAGDLAVTLDGGGLWTDSRYFAQAERQLAGGTLALFRMREPDVPSIERWLADHLRAEQRVGYDPRLVSITERERLAQALDPRGVRLVPVEENLVDAVRRTGVDRPTDPVHLLEQRFAGESVASKIVRVREELAKRDAAALVEPTLDAIAWLLNVRGTDVSYNPVVISYLVLGADAATWFVDEAKVSDAVRAHLAGLVEIRPYDAFHGALGDLAASRARVWIDPATTSGWIADALGGAPLVRALSPIQRLKAVKNPVELAGLEQAMLRDGVAMVRFLRWLDEATPTGGLTESSAAARLDALRAEGEHFRGLSFPTISAYGANAALPHYACTPETNAALAPRGLYLVDSGAQYLDGTTDITRTVALGPVTDDERDRYTRVLRGHVGLATLRFPKGATGRQIELAARRPLWDAGLDYGHGTGHGVGVYLNVHEGPHSISQRPSEVALEPGMISSNEPGYYEPGAYGIRIENLVAVAAADGAGSPAKPFHRLETVTLCPIDTRPVDVAQLAPAERTWLDDYHRTVRERLTPLLADPADRAWLERATAPVGSG